jgi:glycosyltransferase involved in cell wall biosynthesis
MLRLAIVADYAEEGWPSMDLVADMLLDHLRREHTPTINASLIRPAMPRRLTQLPFVSGKLAVLDRALARQWDYPRQLGDGSGGFDVYHIVDHTYAHLVHGLPADRTIVTCHDVDAFRSVLQPEDERRSLPFRWMTKRILSGLRRSAHVPCDSEATRDALMQLAGFPPEQLSVISNGGDAGGSPDADPATDFEAGRILGPRQRVELLHVGSTIDRKRIDVLLEVFAAVRRERPSTRLIRVGGPFTGAQRAHARDLGIADEISVVPFVDRGTLSAVYRRAALTLLPSEREGFGLPLVESLACGTPMVASDIPVLRELGGDAVAYCVLEDVNAWRDTILALLRERETQPERWRARQAQGVARAAEFSWSHYAGRLVELYQSIAERAGAVREPSRMERHRGHQE